MERFQGPRPTVSPLPSRFQPPRSVMPLHTQMSYAPLPTASQTNATRQLIAAKTHQTAAARAQIQQHAARIAELHSMVQKLDREVAVNEAYIAPVRRLPFEVLGHIVTLCATDPGAPVQVLRDLASICKTWRDATLRTPEAWTKIVIEIYTRGEDTGTRLPRHNLRSLRDVQEWYDRSGICKKDVSLRGRDCAELNLVIQLVVSRSSELRAFDPHVYNERPGDIWDELLPRPMPFLRAIWLSRSHPNKEFVTSLAQACPQLSCVRTTGVSSCEALLPLQTRLRRLYLSGSADLVLGILRAGQGFVRGFVNLDWLSLNIYHRSSPSPVSDSSPISLPKLRALFLFIDDITMPFLQILLTPLVDTLSVSRREPDYRGDHITKKQIAALLHAAGDLPLLELRICSLHISDADLIQLLKRMPRLDTLAVVNGKTSDKVMTTLSERQGRSAQWLCPNLARVCVMSVESSKSDKFRVSRDGMGALVKARLRANQTAGSPVARLMRIRLDDSDVVFHSILDDDWAWKRDIVRDGAREINPAEMSQEVQRWWHHPSYWEDL